MKFTEKQLKLYAAPLSESENQKCKNAIGMVRDALKPLGFTDDGHPISLLYEDTLAYAIEMRSTYGSRKIKLSICRSPLITIIFLIIPFFINTTTCSRPVDFPFKILVLRNLAIFQLLFPQTPLPHEKGNDKKNNSYKWKM